MALLILTWNCRRARATSPLWDHLLDLAPDIALLQDFGPPPERVLRAYTHATNHQAKDMPSAGHYQSGVLVRNATAAGPSRDVPLTSAVPWVQAELGALAEFFTAKDIPLVGGPTLRAVSAYCPAYPVDRARMRLVDTTGVQLTRSRDVWATELLWSALASTDLASPDLFAVGGDFNSSESLDWTDAGPRGNREIIDRFNALGLRECLRDTAGRLVPTFRSPRGGELIHQLDHLYVSPALRHALSTCETGSAQAILNPRPMLSDHLPVIAEFALP